MSKYPPSVSLAWLHERISKGGQPYLGGKMGRANVTILKTNKLNSDGNPVWHLLVADAPHLEEKESEESSGEKLSEIEF